MKKSLFFCFSLMGSIGLAVVIPLVGLALLGRYIDNIYQSSPKFLVAGIVLSTIIVFFTLKRIVKQATERFNNME